MTGRGHTAEALAKNDRVRLSILEAAWKLIAQRGYHLVRVSDIARECQMSTGKVHYYFPQKEDVLTEAMRFSTSRVFERQERDLHRYRTGREKLLRLIELQLPQEGMSRDEWSIWLQYWAEAALRPQLRDIHNEAYSRWHNSLVRIIRKGQEEGSLSERVNAETAAIRFMALTDGLGVKLLAGAPSMSIEIMREALVDLVTIQLAPHGPGVVV